VLALHSPRLGPGDAMVKNLVTLTSVVLIGLSHHGLAEVRSHEVETSGDSRNSSVLHEQIRFQAESSQEVLPNAENPELGIQGEAGSFQQSDGKTRKALRVYQGTKGRPGGRLDLIATEAGRARTFIAAQRACEKLAPLGKWRLATVPHIMAFFGGLVEGFSLPQNPERKGYLFWAAAVDEKENKKNKDTFFAALGSGGPELETHSYRDFSLGIKNSVTQSKSADEKKYYLNLLKTIQTGIPVICVGGIE